MMLKVKRGKQHRLYEEMKIYLIISIILDKKVDDV